MADFNVWSYLAKMGVSVKGPGSRTLEEGDQVSGMLTPTFLKLEDIEEFLHKDFQEFHCQAPGCSKTFNQLHECELHYNSVHRHCCSICRKSLPSPHLLELHLQESHDSFFAVMAERKASYQCFLPTCQQVTWTPEERHKHAIEDHKFPSDFRFDDFRKKQKTNSDSASNSKSKQRKKKIVNSNAMEVNGNNNEQVNGQSKLRRPMSLARLGEHFKDSEDGMEVDSVNNRMSLCLDVRVKDDSVLESNSSSKSAKKSRIPVLRSNSCRVPKNLSFGAGIPRGFPSRLKKKTRDTWHQVTRENVVSMETVPGIDNSDMSLLRNSLPT